MLWPRNFIFLRLKTLPFGGLTFLCQFYLHFVHNGREKEGEIFLKFQRDYVIAFDALITPDIIQHNTIKFKFLRKAKWVTGKYRLKSQTDKWWQISRTNNDKTAFFEHLLCDSWPVVHIIISFNPHNITLISNDFLRSTIVWYLEYSLPVIVIVNINEHFMKYLGI